MTRRFPDLAICIGTVKNVYVEKENDDIIELRGQLYEEVRAKYDAETLKLDRIVRAYRDLYWKLGIDPTKIRPSGEALLRRVLRGSELPNISTIVDAYNLASMRTIVPVSGFDHDCLVLPFEVRFAKDDETFTGIGMETPITLTSRMLILADNKQILCIYPYRDSDHTKITMKTQNVSIVGYGAPGVGPKQLKDVVEMTLAFITKAAGGEVTSIQVFPKDST